MKTNNSLSLENSIDVPNEEIHFMFVLFEFIKYCSKYEYLF